ncbi:MAG TPA: amidohydrolase family protein [Gemmatimonadaceae bacterium]|nr:amidohydrolase family protein [Gemmatimonadaceae bacterium]
MITDLRTGLLSRVASAALAGASLVAALVLAPSAATAQSRTAPRPFDVIIRGGRVLDGSGNAWVRADVAIRGDSIVAVGRLNGATATTVLDARGLYVAPGFIDTHSHAGPALETAELAGARQLLAQGITTVFVNPDGGGSVDLAAQRRNLARNGLGVNVALMVPHGSVRQAVLGMADRAPSPAEMARMEELVRRGMEEGAFALSSGPFYAPGSFAKTDELVALAKVAARYGAPYQSHIRDESDYTIGLLAAVEEVITVAREAGTRGVVTHVKALGPNVWGFSAAIVSRVERARAAGVEVFADQYPYEASQTSLSAALVPRWVQADGGDSLRARFADPARRPRIVAEMRENLARRGGADRIRIVRFARDSTLDGKSLAEIAAARGADAIETAIDLVVAGSPGIVSFNMADDDIERLMRQSWTMTASDGALVRMGEGVPHPRGNGAFSRKLRRYVVDEEVVDLPAAIRSMTSLPAAVYNLPDRGSLRAGTRADVVVFDLDRVRDRATFDDPHQVAEGMVHVLVNGRFAIRDGEFTDQPAGQVLRRR